MPIIGGSTALAALHRSGMDTDKKKHHKSDKVPAKNQGRLNYKSVPSASSTGTL